MWIHTVCSNLREREEALNRGKGGIVSPFVLEELTKEDRKTLLRRLDEINVSDERKEFIRMVCSEKQNTD
jgi:hypothetical protein